MHRRHQQAQGAESPKKPQSGLKSTRRGYLVIIFFWVVVVIVSLWRLGGYDSPLNRQEAKFAWFMNPPDMEYHVNTPKKTASLIHLGQGYTCERFLKIGGGLDGDGAWPICITSKLRSKFTGDSSSSSRHCVVYSFGVAEDMSFDLGADGIGCTVHSYDHTIRSLPSVRDSTDHSIIWKQIGLGTEGNDSKYLMSLREILKINGDQFVDVLKIDIEGGEWSFLEEVLESGLIRERVGQFCLEIHFSLESGANYIQPRQTALLESLTNEGGGFDLYYRADNFQGCPQVYWLPGEYGMIGVRRCHNLCYVNRRLLS